MLYNISGKRDTEQHKLLISPYKKNPQHDSNQLISILKVKSNAEINKVFCMATCVTHLESL